MIVEGFLTQDEVTAAIQEYLVRRGVPAALANTGRIQIKRPVGDSADNNYDFVDPWGNEDVRAKFSAVTDASFQTGPYR